MANKRTLKKNIRRVISDLLAANLMAKYLIPGTNKELTNEIIQKVIELEGKTLERANFSFDRTERDFDNPAAFRKARREYFHQAYARLVLDFEEKLKDIITEMNEAKPRLQKKEQEA